MATVGVFFPSFFILVLLIPYHDRLRGVEKVRMMEQGILGSFIGMLALVLYNFGSTSLVDIPRILMAAAAFFAIYKKISLPYILLAGAVTFHPYLWFPRLIPSGMKKLNIWCLNRMRPFLERISLTVCFSEHISFVTIH